MPKPKLLIINYLFPPAGGIAVQRVISLAKHLPRLGFEVHVLSAGNAATPVRDPGLLKHVPPEVTVHRSFTPELPFEVQKKLWSLVSPPAKAAPAAPAPQPSSRPGWKSRAAGLIKKALTPDPQVVWVPFALRKARRIIRRHGIDAVLVSVPPFSTFLATNALKREFPHLRLISDFRDEWLNFYLEDFEFQGSSYTRRRAEEIERTTIQLSDLVVAVTHSSLQTIRDRYPDQPDSKFACVHNGYDADLFKGFTSRPHNQPKVLVTHMGTAYKTASPRYYLDALDQMPAEIRARIATRFIGRVSEEEQACLTGRKSDIQLLGFMSQSQALREVETTDYLLLTMTNDISLPGKLFEYLATGKPILALSPAHGEVNRILQATRAGWCVDPQDPVAIQEMLAKAIRLASDKSWFQPDRDAIQGFERASLAELYGRRIRALLGS